MPRDDSMYMAHVGFDVCCSECVGVCGNVCCVAENCSMLYVNFGSKVFFVLF